MGRAFHTNSGTVPGEGDTLQHSTLVVPPPPSAQNTSTTSGSPHEAAVMVVDAAEDGTRFRVGVVGSKGMHRSLKCPHNGSWRSNRQSYMVIIWLQSVAASAAILRNT